MTTLAYFFIGGDGEETMPRLEVVGEAHGAIQWYCDMAPMACVAAPERPGFAELIRFARRGDVLIVSSRDRLGTSAAELLGVFQTLESMGVTIVSLR